MAHQDNSFSELTDEEIRAEIADVEKQIASLTAKKKQLEIDLRTPTRHRNKAIAEAVFKGATFTELAKQYNVSPVTVRTLFHKFCIRRNKEAFEAGAPTPYGTPPLSYLRENRTKFGV